MDSSNNMVLELIKGLIEAHDKKTLGGYLPKQDGAQEEMQSGESEMPELSEEEMAALDEEEM